LFKHVEIEVGCKIPFNPVLLGLDSEGSKSDITEYNPLQIYFFVRLIRLADFVKVLVDGRIGEGIVHYGQA
jgi:hypothetical protein